MHQNKVVLITGASSGIGASCVWKFAKHHYDIILHYHQNETKAREIKQKVEEETSVHVLLQQADLKKETDIKRMVKESLQEFGHIDTLVNNAAIALDTMWEEKTKEQFAQVFSTNVIGPFLLSREVGEHMKNAQKGEIILVSSTNGIDTPYPESVDYDCSKAAIHSLMQNLASVYAPWVRVNVVAPGWVDTPMNQNLDPAWKQEEIKSILLKRFATPDEIANVIYFLASKEASYINKSIIRVDGGTKS